MAHAPSPERRHLILSVTAPDAFLSLTRSILSRIGYEIVDRDEWSEAPSLYGQAPHLCVVEDDRLSELPKHGAFERVPLILLAEKGRAQSDDRRVVGSLLRPAGPHELFRLLQTGLEPHPRGALRAPADLPATIRRDGKTQDAWIRSISENGCLARTREGIDLGTNLELSFELPNSTPLCLHAEASYRLVPDVGIVFHATGSEVRRGLLSFVEAQLSS